MRVLFAPDSFSGTLSAGAAADAMAAGWREQRPDDDLVCLPMADGGEGTLDVVAAATTCERRTATVANARGYAVEADWLLLADGTAVIESAQACGLHRLPPDLRNPRLATTYGVGQLIAAALRDGASRIVVGLGGSATVDGGAGMATALGHRLLRADGNGVKVGGEYLTLLDRIVPAGVPSVPVVAGADVTAPLFGPDGAVAGFAAQKGAAPADIPVLDQALTRLADVVERDLDRGPWRDVAGSGAAGGLGFGLAAFVGAQLRAGAAMVADLLDLSAAIAAADLVVTGEGRLDKWSGRGKAPGYVATLAAAATTPVLAISGSAGAEVQHRFDAVVLLGDAGLRSPAQAVAAAAAKLAGAR